MNNMGMRHFFQKFSLLSNIKFLFVLLFILFSKILWDQSEIKALHSVITTVSIASTGTPLKDLTSDLRKFDILLLPGIVDYNLLHKDSYEYNKYSTYIVRFTSHNFIFSWGYQVIVFIDSKTKTVISTQIGTFGTGI